MLTTPLSLFWHGSVGGWCGGSQQAGSNQIAPSVASACSNAYRGLISPLITRSRSGKGANADFMPLIVSHSKSDRSQPKASRSLHISVVIDVLLIRRLSVLTVTRKRSRRSIPIGWSATESQTPVLTLDVGHSSR